MGNVLYVDHPDYWEWKMATQSRKAAGDPTWKERHAKGVPVKMELDEWRDCIINTQKIDNVHPSRHEHHGGITIWVEDWNDYVSDETVKFCNFRYKPEWLEKHKKQTI